MVYTALRIVYSRRYSQATGCQSQEEPCRMSYNVSRCSLAMDAQRRLRDVGMGNRPRCVAIELFVLTSHVGV